MLKRLVCLAGMTLASRPAAAQSPADTSALVVAVATVLSDSVVPRLGANRVFLYDPAPGFDARVTHQVQEMSGLPLLASLPDTATWLVTRGVDSLEGDTAAVLVETGYTSETQPGESLIDTYIETNRFVFVRSEGGWRFLRREFVRGADLGPVRG